MSIFVFKNQIAFSKLILKQQPTIRYSPTWRYCITSPAISLNCYQNNEAKYLFRGDEIEESINMIKRQNQRVLGFILDSMQKNYLKPALATYFLYDGQKKTALSS